MNVDEEILDIPEASNQGSPKFKSRVPSDLLIVLGILHLIFSVYCLYQFFSLLQLAFQDVEEVGLVIDYPLFSDIVLYRNFSCVYGIVLLIGGVGLIRHKIRGWKYALGASIFGIVLPALTLTIALAFNELKWGMGAFNVILFVMFGASFIFLLSKPIRKFFKPQTLDFGISAIITSILIIDFLVLLFV